MSYILDAIKKSEAERNQGLTPGALAGSSTATVSRGPSRIITALVTLNLAALAVWWWWQSAAPIETIAQEPEQQITYDQGQRATRQGVSVPGSRAATSQPQIAVPAPESPPAPTAPVFSGPPVAPSFSTHVYADDPELRAVTLNGRRLVEGDVIEPGMRIIEITETGVVVDYNGDRLELDVLQDWRT